MTFAIGHIEGGTNAGRKRQKPAPKPWTCGCYEDRACKTRRCDGLLVDGMCPFGYGVTCEALMKRQPAYMSRCPDCKTERP